MGKPTDNKLKYNDDVIDVLKEKYGFQPDYIRKSIRGDRTGTMPDLIKKDYRELANKILKIIEDFRKRGLNT